MAERSGFEPEVGFEPPRPFVAETADSIETRDSAAAELARPIADGCQELERPRPEVWIERQRDLRHQADGRRERIVEESRADLLAAIKAWRSARLCERFLDDVELHAANLPETERVRLFHRTARARALMGPVDAAQRLLDWRTPEER